MGEGRSRRSSKVVSEAQRRREEIARLQMELAKAMAEERQASKALDGTTGARTACEALLDEHHASSRP
eukprot:scaffold1629_cov369-Prasinococcus_capsulatus_cf.AAC.32